MSLETEIVVDLAVVMTVALTVTFIFQKLRQPIILGYLVAGILIGPYTPPFSFVSRLDVLSAFAEIGVIMLLFAIGLGFPIAKLRAIGRVAGGVAAIEIISMFVVAYFIGLFLKWPFIDILFLGAALASSSTTIIAKVLSDMGKIREIPATIMLGILVVEDLVVVSILALLLSFGSIGVVSLTTIALTCAKVGLFVGGLLVIGGWVVPRIMDRAVFLENRELLLIGALALCFASSVLALRLGLSVAIGAFLMGVLVASSKSTEYIAHDIAPLKDVFGALFFTSMGALIDISQFQAFIVPGIIISVGIIVAKLLGVGFGTRSFGYSRDVSVKVSLGMSQIGEFAFIVVKGGQDLNIVSSFLLPSIGVAVGITSFLTPYLMRVGYSRRW
jgi:CPA2 family monovalent cation:H+ antiporter-2